MADSCNVVVNGTPTPIENLIAESNAAKAGTQGANWYMLHASLDLAEIAPGSAQEKALEAFLGLHPFTTVVARSTG